MIKKLISLFVALACCISLCACGTHSEDATSPDSAPTEPTSDETAPEHVHEYEATDTIAVTCLDNGYTIYACACGDSYQADHIEATGHVWNEWITLIAATETTTGTAERYCSVCSEMETKELARIDPDHTHEYTSTVVKQPTCSSFGAEEFVCSCGDAYTEEIAKTAHSYTTTVTAPTCTAQGYTTYQCSNCGSTKKDDYVNAAGHSYKDTVTKPTCTADGYTTHKCAVCGHTYKDTVTKSTGHNWSAWVTTKAPTALFTGLAERKCNSCGEIETKVLDKIKDDHQHSYSPEITKAATCTYDGIKTYLCACGDSYTETIQKTGHNYQSTVTAPTCTEQGYTAHTCSRCNDSYKTDYTEAKGHSWNNGEITKEPTCTSEGVKKYTCSACKATRTESIQKLAHDYTSNVVAPTCTADGYTLHTCSRCNGSYKDSTTPALGHSWNDGTVTTKPTCTRDGVKTYTCTRSGCGQTKTEAVAKTGHSYQVVSDTATCEADGTKTSKCSSCAATKEEASPATGHVNTTTTRVEPTCVEDGYTATTCNACGTVLSKTVIPASGSHSYTKTMTLSTAATNLYNAGITSFAIWMQHEDFDVKVCSGCGMIDLDTMKFKYSDTQASNIMMGYINDLRAAKGVFDLELDPALLATARVMMNEYTTNGYISTSTTAYRWNVDGGYSIKMHFEQIKASSKFFSYNYEYFAYVADVPKKHQTNLLYGIALLK